MEKCDNVTVKKEPKPKITPEIIVDALRESKGIVTAAANLIQNKYHVKMTRSALAMRIHRSAKLKAELDNINETQLDVGESKLFDLMNEGDKTALIFFLKCKGKHRGWTERQEVTGANGNPVVAAPPVIEVNFTDKPADVK